MPSLRLSRIFRPPLRRVSISRFVFLLYFCIDPCVGLLRVLPGAVGWGPARGHVPPPHRDQFGSIVCCRRSCRGPGKDHKRIRALPGKPGCASYPADCERALFCSIPSPCSFVLLRLRLVGLALAAGLPVRWVIRWGKCINRYSFSQYQLLSEVRKKTRTGRALSGAAIRSRAVHLPVNHLARSGRAVVGSTGAFVVASIHVVPAPGRIAIGNDRWLRSWMRGWHWNGGWVRVV